MRKIFLVLLAVFAFKLCLGQSGYQSYIDGAPATLIKKVDVEGSEFLYEKWLPATVKNTKGNEFKNIMVKYNLLEDVPYFLGKLDQAMSFTVPLDEFIIQKENGELQKFKSGFPPMEKYNELTFYEVLVDGNAKLLKKVSKKIVESRAYNSATTVKNILDNTNYFIFEEGKLSAVKKDKKSVATVLKKNDEMKKYFSDKSVSVKSEDGLLKAIEHYNNL